MAGLQTVVGAPGPRAVESAIKKKPSTGWDHKTKLSQKEIAELWIAAGGETGKADLMSAIAMAESDGIVRNGNYCCHGLWAFNVEVGVTSMACALKPSCAASKAVELSQDGTELKPWETYTNGAYKKFLGKSGVLDQGAEAPTLRGPEELIGKVTSPIAGILGFIGRLFEPSFWLRVGKGIAGFLLLAFGALTLMKVLLGVDIPTGAVSSAKLAAGFMA